VVTPGDHDYERKRYHNLAMPQLATPSGGATLWQSSANALPVCCHALPVALPVF